eukprot:4123388-Prymnesium_polylepis.2
MMPFILWQRQAIGAYGGNPPYAAALVGGHDNDYAPRVVLNLKARLPAGPAPTPGIRALVFEGGQAVIVFSYLGGAAERRVLLEAPSLDKSGYAFTPLSCAGDHGRPTRKEFETFAEQNYMGHVDASIFPPADPETYEWLVCAMPALRHLAKHGPFADAAEEDEASDVPEPGDPLVGECITIRGLKAKPELNGQVGLVTRWLGTRGRYEVQIATVGAFEDQPAVPRERKKVLLKAANLRVNTNVMFAEQTDLKYTSFEDEVKELDKASCARQTKVLQAAIDSENAWEANAAIIAMRNKIVSTDPDQQMGTAHVQLRRMSELKEVAAAEK